MSQEIEIFIPVKEEQQEPGVKALHEVEHIPFTQEMIESLASKFTNFELQQVELSVDAAITSGQIVKLIANVEGKGGMRLVFTRKK